MTAPPIGTINFLFTDIVGSTRLWEKFPDQMKASLAQHDIIVRSSAENHQGHIFKTVGDAFCVAFQTPREALQAAIEAQRRLGKESWGEVGLVTSRMGIHTGTAEYRDHDYFGGTLNRTSRIEAAAHGGQILLSQISYELLEDDKLEGVTFKSLGSHRLRNLDRPEHLFQVVTQGIATDFPPPRSMEVLPNNLPVQTTSFVGRDREIIEVEQRLENSRLLTLMGPGGTGKTRLALEVGARRINDFRDGVWLVELALVTDPDRILETLALTINVREESHTTLRETVGSFLRDKTVLLILDNCEHLLSAVAPLCRELLRVCPRLKILAASRHSLGLGGEITYPVPPLSIFDVREEELSGPNLVEQLSSFEAVRLFIDRAKAVRPDFALTKANARALAQICSRLDGIPLAIELAAARVNVLDLDQIVVRLGDRFRLLHGRDRGGHLPHQQTLQALIDWSHDLLSEPERILFRRLGGLVGGRTLEAVETICAGDGLEGSEILDLIQQLIEKSLVAVEYKPGEPPRYTMIESVWQYAREKLETSGEAEALRNRHLDYFLHFAEAAAPRLEGLEQKSWLDRCHSERFNFREAFAHTVRERNPEVGFRILTAIYRAIEIRGNLEESRQTINDLLALPRTEVPTRCTADFLLAAGRLAWAADRYEECRQFHEQARAIYESIGHEIGRGLCEMLMGFLDRGDGKPETAEAHFQKGLKMGHRHPSAVYLSAGCLSGLGSIALDRHDLATARKLKEESLVLYEQLGDQWIIGLVLWGLVQVCLAEEDGDRARSALAQWARITRDLGNRWMLPYLLECSASLAALDGRPEDAALILGAAEAAREFSGTRFAPSEQARHDKFLATLQSVLVGKDFPLAWEKGRQTSPWDAIGMA